MDGKQSFPQKEGSVESRISRAGFLRGKWEEYFKKIAFRF